MVCDTLGRFHDKCVPGGKFTGFLGLIYDVFLADIPECATGQAEACAGATASVAPGGGMGKLGKAAEEAAKAAKAGEGAAKAEESGGRALWQLTKEGSTAGCATRPVVHFSAAVRARQQCERAFRHRGQAGGTVAVGAYDVGPADDGQQKVGKVVGIRVGVDVAVALRRS